MRFYVRGLGILLALAVCLPLHILVYALTGRSFWYARFLIVTAWIAGVRIRREGVPLGSHVLFAANHTSWLDIVLLGGATGGAFVSKEEVADWPAVGLLARVGGTIFIARGERSAVRAQADRIAQALQSGRPVILFPEGTTGGEGRLLPFRASLFAAVAGRSGIAVQPIAIDYGGLLDVVRWPREESAGSNARRLLARPGTIPVTLRVLAPIDPAPLDRKALAAEVERAVGEALSADSPAVVLSAAPAGPALPAGERIYAIGDIHGRHDLLCDLIDRINRDAAARPALSTRLIFLGDLIDRGPASADVVAHLLALAGERPGTVMLMGNHEEVFLHALDGVPAALRLFDRIGGRATALSYGIDGDAYDEADAATLAALLATHVPPEHRAFLRGFENMIVLGDYVFAHAGIRPDVALDEQQPADLRWIRQEFLNHTGPMGKVVVHGHSIAEAVEVAPHRIGIDTGAYATGRLTAIGLEGGDRWIIQTGDDLLSAPMS